MLIKPKIDDKWRCVKLDKIMAGVTALTTAATTFSGGYAALKFVLMGIGHMEKNPQKVEAARDGMKNIVIGFMVCLAALMIVSWLKSILG